MPALRGARTVQLRTGPWKRVQTTEKDPWDDATDELVDAGNIYIPDPIGGSGIAARPGWSIMNGGQPVSNTAGIRGQGVLSHISLGGTAYNFAVFGGKLYRADSVFVLYEDVTPVGVTIDSGTTTRVYGTSLGDQFIVTDGVHRPWIASSLDSTPIVGTYIDFDGAATEWTAYGRPTVYGGSIIFVLNTVGSDGARFDIAYSLPGDATLGYQQPTYDFRSTMEQATPVTPLFAVAGTNTGLYYFRQHSIGVISGAIGPDLSSTATHDALSQNVGTITPAGVVQYGEEVYFLDQMGRPYRLADRQLDPIWLQMRGIIDDGPVTYPNANAAVASAAYEPYLNLYVSAPFTTDVVAQGAPDEMYGFDVKTRNYIGRWRIASQDGTTDAGCSIDCLGTFTDPTGRGVLMALGSILAPVDGVAQASGYIWALNGATSGGPPITTEPAGTGLVITTEDGLAITTEGTNANWMDGDYAPDRWATTPRLFYDSDTVLDVDRVTVLTGSDDPIEVLAQSAAITQSVVAVPKPSLSYDNVNRATAGFDRMHGRGCEVTVRPTTALEQWTMQSVTVQGTLSKAGEDEF